MMGIQEDRGNLSLRLSALVRVFNQNIMQEALSFGDITSGDYRHFRRNPKERLQGLGLKRWIRSLSAVWQDEKKPRQHQDKSTDFYHSLSLEYECYVRVNNIKNETF